MDLLSGLKNLFKIDYTTIDNGVFRLHYKVTGTILIAFSILVTGRQYLGDPIDCISRDDIPPKVLDTFCWIHTTFSLPKHWKKKVGYEVPYPGVGKHVEGDEVVFHAYYQWVCFVLFLQAILFYLPRYFWKAMEGCRIKNLILGLNVPVISVDTRTQNKKLLVEYLVENLNNHNLYFTCYVMAEILNFVNVVGQIYLMDRFLGGEFLQYGVEVLKHGIWDESAQFDPMIKVFPRLTKCRFHKFGSSGDVQRHDALCILPINVINEKIYIFLWFWFIILSVISALVLIYRLVIIFWPELRFLIIRSRNRIVDPESLHNILKRAELGDWLILDFLAKNLDPLHFRDIIHDFSKNLSEKHFDYVSC